MQRLYRYLTPELTRIISALPDEAKKEACELRLRKGGALSVSTYTKNLFVTKSSRLTLKLSEGYICTSEDVMSVVSLLTENSVYRYMNTINSGYIVTPEGIRAGIAGSAVYEKNIISTVSDFTSLNIRIPRNIFDCADTLIRFLDTFPASSLLIFSPPGYGKTTVIRALSQGLATGRLTSPKRVAVIDERGEILPEGTVGLADRLVGYSKPDGIEIAVRLFSPEYIVCDEIGLADDTESILSVQNIGVPFIATAHASSLDELLLRPNIKRLIDANVFDYFARLERGKDGSNIILEEIK